MMKELNDSFVGPLPSVIRIGISPWSNMNIHCFPHSKTGCNAGVELDILQTILPVDNVRIELVVSEDTQGCGGKNADGEWTDLLKLLHEGRIDVIGNLCKLNKMAQYADDDEEFAWSWPVWQYRDQFVIQAPVPPPVSFAPWVPFQMAVWVSCAFIFLTYFSYVVFHSSVKKPKEKFHVHLVQSFKILADVFCSFKKDVPASVVWSIWLFFMTFVALFYNTYILSAVLYPYPVYKPFSNSEELVRELMSGRYRLLSYRDPPAVLSDCLGKPCEADFQEAIAKHGYESMDNSTGGSELLSRIASQDPEASTKLVLVNGMPFVNLYLSEFLHDRNRLWIIDSKAFFELWVGFVWRKNFTLGRQMNLRLRQIGDFRLYALSRYMRPQNGGVPQTGDYVSEKLERESIELFRFERMFYILFAGWFCGSVGLGFETFWAGRRRLIEHF